MKNIKFIGLIVVLLTMAGCKKWLDVNVDPANPQVPKAEYLLSPIIFQMANNTANDYRVIFKYTQNMFSQDVLAASIDWDKHGYAPANDLGGSLWRMTYVSIGLNLEELLKDAEANNKWTYAGIGYAIKAWDFQMLTDAHGPVILDQAFDKNRITFNYQDQPEVYLQVRKWCQKALVCLDKKDGADYTGQLAGPSGDTMYKGDKAKWKKFIYGILAQQFSHLVNKPEFTTSYADSVTKYVDLSFASSAEDATIAFNGSTSGGTGDSNPFSPNFGLITSVAYGRIGQPIVDLLAGGVRGVAPVNPTSSVDPRLSVMLTPIAVTGVYKGIMPTMGDAATVKTIPSVLGSVATTASSPFPGKYIFANAARFPIMGFAQLQFAKSEALFLKGDKSGAYNAYLNAIKGHMDFVNLYGRNGSPAAPAITTVQISAYLGSNQVAQTPVDLSMADIMGQKYIAQWGWAGMEQWCDMRKYHYDPTIFRTFKQLEASQFFAANLGKYAYRLRPRYNSEYVWNKDELAKWGGLQPNYHTMETWFSLPN